MTHSPYNQNPLDKYTIDAHESVLGHLLKERGWTLQQALSFLAPEVNAQRKGSGLASSVSLTTAIGGSLAAVGSFAFLGLGFALLPAVAAAFNAWQYCESKGQASRREAEFNLHMQFPGLSKLLWDLHSHGLPIDQLVHGYDRLVDACQSLLDGYSPGFDLNETTVVAILQDTIQQHQTLSAPTVLGIPAPNMPKTAAAPLPPTQLEPPPVVPTENREQPTVTAPATLRVGNQSERLEHVDRTQSEVSSVPAAPRSISELRDRIKAECPALLRLMMAPPIRLTGVQRSGKTSAAKVICLLRMLLIPDHRVLACTPHLEPENGYPQAFQVVGHRGSGRRDMEAIESSWNQIQQHIENGRKLNLSTIFDEFGAYSDGFSDPEALTLSLRSMLREATKHQLYPIIVIHGESKAFVSGSAGLFQVLMSSTVRLETIGEAIGDLGQVRPTGRLRIKWLDGTQEECRIPDWLTEDLLLGLLPHPGYHPSPAPIGSADRAHLESCLAASPAAAVGHPEATPPEATDPAIELIQQEPNLAKREALEIAYKWAMNRLENGNDATREAFLNRAKNERKCEYLRENRDDVWEALETLIS